MLEKLANLMKLLAAPLGILNALGGIVSVIWLIVLHDWSTLLGGVALLFASSFVIGILMLPAAGIMAATVAVGAKTGMRGVLFWGLVFLDELYGSAVISVWCLAIFFIFMALGRQAHNPDLPYLLGSYALALGPWQSMAAKEAGPEGEGFTTLALVFFTQVAYVAIMLMVLVANPSIVEIAAVFGAIMLIVMIVLARVGVLLRRELT